MKKILLSSFFIAFGIAAMAQAKPSSKQITTPPKKANTEAAQKELAAHIAWKNKMAADAAQGKKPEQKQISVNATAAAAPMSLFEATKQAENKSTKKQ